MFSGRYLQNRFSVLLGAFTLLLLCVSVFAENDPVTTAPGHNETDSSGEHVERFETGMYTHIIDHYTKGCTFETNNITI